MKSCFALVVGLALTGCSQNPVAPLPDDGGANPDSGHLVEAGILEAATSDGPVIPDGDVLYDATMDVTEAQLGVPTFWPPPGSLEVGLTVAISVPLGSPSDTVIYYSTNGQAPSAATGNLYVGAPIQILYPTGPTETVMAVASAPGFLDSPVATAVYSESMPDCGGCGDAPVTFSQQSSSQEVPFLLGLSWAAGATICYSVDGVTTPTCTAAGKCVSPALTYTAPIAIGPSVTGPGGSVTVTAVGCAPGQGQNAPVSQTFLMFLAPPYLASQNSVGTGLPGWDWSGTGKPLTTMAIPGDAGAPYGPFVAQQVSSLPCTGVSTCTGPALALADFVCWSTTGPATCSCANPLSLTPATPYATLPASADVSPGGTLSVIACQAAKPVNAPGFYAASGATTVQF